MENFDGQLFLKALGLAMAIEGIIWAGFPEKMRRAAAYMAAQPQGALRVCGLLLLGIGVAVCALSQF